MVMAQNTVAVVIGASGGIGQALADALEESQAYGAVLRMSRGSSPPLDLASEPSITAAAANAAARGPIRLVVAATGFLHGSGLEPEKSNRQMTPEAFAHAFAVNATGPALLMKHFLPLMPRAGRSVFVALSAKVGSIGDNRLGGWHAYRASKAALNQIVRTAAIEWQRTHRDGILAAIHPGTVDTGLSRPFAKSALAVKTPSAAARDLLDVISRLQPSDSGGFFSHDGTALPW
jgi:NAD(P)-dependent dehydrogenase (short-subunit alcohol dehydrogenase family)